MTIKCNKLSRALGAFALVLAAPVVLAIPIVQNGDFSAGETGWNLTGSVVDIQDNLSHSPDAGGITVQSARFINGGDGASGSLSQTFSTSFVDSFAYRLTFFFHGNLGLLSSLGTLGQSLSDIDFDGPNDLDTAGWGRYTAQFTGYSGNSLAFNFAPIVSAGPLNIDDVSVQCLVAGACTTVPDNDVPEPGSLLLLGTALAAVAVVRRRKKA
jgi:hypothetical protein